MKTERTYRTWQVADSQLVAFGGELLRGPQADLRRLAERMTAQLERNGQSRVDHWHGNADRLPPPRLPP